MSSHPSIHPQYGSKVVFELQCSYCQIDISTRGMQALLLGDTRVELYSTDTPPKAYYIINSSVELVQRDYFTQNCHCRIRDAACLGWYINANVAVM